MGAVGFESNGRDSFCARFFEMMTVQWHHEELKNVNGGSVDSAVPKAVR